VSEGPRESAETTRWLIERGRHDPSSIRAALLNVPPTLRDRWLDTILGLGPLPEDGPELPRGCVPYLPGSVEVLLRLVDHAPVRSADVFVDVGSGLGRAAMLVHLLTGAAAVGIEVQPAFARASRATAARLGLDQISIVEGDAASLTGSLSAGSVFFFYCPFGGDRLAKVLAAIELVARARTLRICCVDLPLPPCPWLTLEAEHPGNLAIYRSTNEVSSGDPAGAASPGAAPRR
jgi:predicted RNA methylase